jgi:hypothetical protein
LSYVIVAVEFAQEGVPFKYPGQFLEWYKPNVPLGQTMASWTNDLKKAMKFDTAADAFAEWKRERTVPTPSGGRMIPDGKPNRPLTAVTIEVKKAEDIELGERNRRKEAEALSAKLAKGMADEGLLINGGWLLFEAVFMPPGSVSEQQRHDMRMAFMAGADHLWSGLMVTMDQGKEPTAADDARMIFIQNELDLFREEFDRYYKKQQPKEEGTADAS